MRNGLFHGLILVSLLSLIILTGGVVGAFAVTGGSGGDETKAVATATPRTGDLKIAVLGDSLAVGTGNAQGQGFGELFAGKIRRAGGVTLTNKAVNGLTTQGLLAQLSGGSLNEAVATADLILLSAGGNDLRGVQAVEASKVAETYPKLKTAYEANMKGIFALLRRLNPKADIMLLGLYNPSGTAGSAEEDRYIREWDSLAASLAAQDPGTLYMPVYDLFRYRAKTWIAADGLHPNKDGYTAIADRMYGSMGSKYEP